MRNILKLTRLDFRTVQPYLTGRTILVLLVSMGIFVFFTDGSVAMIAMVMAIGSMFVSYPFAVGEQNGIDTLYATLPLGRQTVVAGRYLFALGMNAAAGVVAYCLLSAAALVRRAPFDPGEALAVLGASFVLFTLTGALQLPLYFRLGYARAKMLAYLPYILVPLLAVGATTLMGDGRWAEAGQRALDAAAANPTMTALAAVVVWVELMALSVSRSLAAYRRREF